MSTIEFDTTGVRVKDGHKFITYAYTDALQHSAIIGKVTVLLRGGQVVSYEMPDGYTSTRFLEVISTLYRWLDTPHDAKRVAPVGQDGVGGNVCHGMSV